MAAAGICTRRATEKARVRVDMTGGVGGVALREGTGECTSDGRRTPFEGRPCISAEQKRPEGGIPLMGMNRGKNQQLIIGLSNV